MKARGEYRTGVPSEIMRLYNVFANATSAAQCMALDGDTCFICQRWCDSVCAACCLWSHPDCCQSLAERVCNKDGSPRPDTSDSRQIEDWLASTLTTTYMASSEDRQGDHVNHLRSFAAQPKDLTGPFLSDIQLLQSLCPLCGYVLRPDV